MKLRMLLCALIVALFTFQTIPVSALDEGMWTFNNVPKADIKQTKVGKRTVMAYLLGRILPVMSEGMREP